MDRPVLTAGPFARPHLADGAARLVRDGRAHHCASLVASNVRSRRRGRAAIGAHREVLFGARLTSLRILQAISAA
ncbi:hypothetical protein XI06_03590 [Bradyrhizobium sp. CCBAU 11434]|nr:hypothetical protein [Bradyrhizobium sp. CCBAU 11434]